MVAYFKLHYPLISVSIFLSFIIVAHIFSSTDYSFVKNTISDLGAQGYNKKLIMQTGFFIVWNYIELRYIVKWYEP